MTTPDAAPWAPAGRPDLERFVPRERRLGPLLLWLGCLAGAVALLLWLGDGRLASPDLTAPSTWGDWVRSRGTTDATMAALRVVGLGLAWYLVGVTAVSVLAHLAQAARLVRLADALSFGPVRTVVQQALGIGLAVGVVASALPGDALVRPPATTAEASGPVHELDVPAALDSSDDPAADPLGEAAERGVVTAPDLRRPATVGGPADRGPGRRPTAAATPEVGTGGRQAVRDVDERGEGRAPVPGPLPVVATPDDTQPPPDDDAPMVDASSGGPATPERSQPADASVEGADSSPSTSSSVRPTRREVRVEPGDHLWGISERDLRDALGREPSESEVLAHWGRVVDLNTERLMVPSNPDLLSPGQLVALPEVEVDP